MTRQYSLTGDCTERRSWKIAIRVTMGKQGQSEYIHDHVEGMTVGVRGPRNHFILRESQNYLFIAGGIGITPIAAMIVAADRSGSDWSLAYGGRSRASMAYHRELIERYGSRVSLYPEDEGGLLDLDAIIGEPHAQRLRLVYCCGPEGLIAAVEERSSNWPDGALQVERFAPKLLGKTAADKAFEVELASTGKIVQIPPNQSILRALEEVGVDLPFSCSEGTCGTCETSVLEGLVDHRDSILSRSERDRNDTMMPCVSRAKSARLVLDL